MQLAEALELKDEYLRNYTANYVSKEYQSSSLSAIMEAIAASTPSDRLAMGLSSASGIKSGSEKDSFRLELRVQRTDGPAFREAERIAKEVKGEARIRVLPRVSFPSLAMLLESMRNLGSFPDPTQPLQLGDPVRCNRAGAGTLGGFVTMPKGPGLISSSHVIAAYASGIEPGTGDLIYRPKKGGGVMRSSAEVAKLTDWNVLDAATGNTIDAAFADLKLNQAYAGNIIPSAPQIPSALHRRKLTALPPATSDEIRQQFRQENFRLLNQRVAKLGASTGYTEGIISGALIDGITAHHTKLGAITYLNVFEIEPVDRVEFTLPGDSGSAVFLPDTMEVIGLHFASADALDENNSSLGFRVSYACSIQTVFSEFAEYQWM